MAEQNYKDYFSAQAGLYATFRPVYPSELYDFIFSHVGMCENAWDCATGNGQVATYLSHHFKNVFATDISREQLVHATQRDNIHYAISPAETTSFADHHFDLITVGQALHWFDLDKFYEEVRRVSKPGGLLAAWGYNFLSIDAETDAVIMNFYKNTVGPYWDTARQLVEDSYASIPFPFIKIPCQTFFYKINWTLEQLGGYLLTWSATQKYLLVNGINPVPDVIEALKLLWKESESRTVTFPIFLKLGRIH